jgi:low temperature requirement protein LtrA
VPPAFPLSHSAEQGRHTPTVPAVNRIPFRLPTHPRDPHEHGRVSTPLELFFDLVFVVAIASNAAQLHHGISGGHWSAIEGYTLTWFAIWWAWVNYTWFASAYDNQDVPYRLLTFLIMAGALALAAGVPDIFADGQSVVVVAGYAVMRVGMIGLWLRAAAGHPERRKTALLYAGGILFAQLLWVGRLWVPESWWIPTFFACVAIELLVPVVAENLGGRTPFHPHHLAERYSLLTIIVLGEVILSSVQAVQGAMAAAADAVAGPVSGGSGHHVSFGSTGGAPGEGASMAPLIVGGLLTVFAIWWFYFKRDHADLIEGQHTVWVFGYGHLPIFASVAAVGAGLAAAVDVVQGESEVGVRPVALVLAVSVAMYALTLAGLHTLADREGWRGSIPAVVTATGVLIVPFLGLSMGVSVLAIGLVLALAVTNHVWVSNRAA